MIITICGSNTFSKEMVLYRNKLNQMGHTAIIHPLYDKYVAWLSKEGNFSQGEQAMAKEKNDFIKWYYHAILNSDAILVLNFDKGNIKNYVGGNTLMEIAFAYVHEKKVFLLNPIPEISYKDEISAMASVILNGEISKIC